MTTLGIKREYRITEAGRAMRYQPKQDVRILSFVGFDRDWSQMGRIVRADVTMPDWYIVRFNDDGGELCINASRLMPSNGAP